MRVEELIEWLFAVRKAFKQNVMKVEEAEKITKLFNTLEDMLTGKDTDGQYIAVQDNQTNHQANSVTDNQLYIRLAKRHYRKPNEMYLEILQLLDDLSKHDIDGALARYTDIQKSEDEFLKSLALFLPLQQRRQSLENLLQSVKTKEDEEDELSSIKQIQECIQSKKYAKVLHLLLLFKKKDTKEELPPIPLENSPEIPRKKIVKISNATKDELLQLYELSKSSNKPEIKAINASLAYFFDEAGVEVTPDSDGAPAPSNSTDNFHIRDDSKRQQARFAMLTSEYPIEKVFDEYKKTAVHFANNDSLDFRDHILKNASQIYDAQLTLKKKDKEKTSNSQNDDAIKNELAKTFIKTIADIIAKPKKPWRVKGIFGESEGMPTNIEIIRNYIAINNLIENADSSSSINFLKHFNNIANLGQYAAEHKPKFGKRLQETQEFYNMLVQMRTQLQSRLVL